MTASRCRATAGPRLAAQDMVTRAGRPLHLVAACDEAEPRVFVVTVYRPDPGRWEEYRRRR